MLIIKMNAEQFILTLGKSDLNLRVTLELNARVTWKSEFDMADPTRFTISEIVVDQIHQAYYDIGYCKYRLEMLNKQYEDDFVAYVNTLILRTLDAEVQIHKYMSKELVMISLK